MIPFVNVRYVGRINKPKHARMLAAANRVRMWPRITVLLCYYQCSDHVKHVQICVSAATTVIRLQVQWISGLAHHQRPAQASSPSRLRAPLALSTDRPDALRLSRLRRLLPPRNPPASLPSRFPPPPAGRPASFFP
jgi:hypothetical protein